MAMVDERGRLFGRWNLLDLAVLILLVGLIPMAYGAYALFHDRPPVILSVTPSQIQESPEFTVTIVAPLTDPDRPAKRTAPWWTGSLNWMFAFAANTGPPRASA